MEKHRQLVLSCCLCHVILLEGRCTPQLLVKQCHLKWEKVIRTSTTVVTGYYYHMTLDMVDM